MTKTNLHFNASHSKSAFLIGFDWNGQLGIDMEMLNGSEDLPQLSEYAFSEAENQFCQKGENHERFAEIWTLKEAYLKATGVGLVDPLTSITVAGNTPNEIRLHQLNQKTFSCPNGETGSIVYRNIKPLRFIKLMQNKLIIKPLNEFK